MDVCTVTEQANLTTNAAAVKALETQSVGYMVGQTL